MGKCNVFRLSRADVRAIWHCGPAEADVVRRVFLARWSHRGQHWLCAFTGYGLRYIPFSMPSQYTAWGEARFRAVMWPKGWRLTHADLDLWPGVPESDHAAAYRCQQLHLFGLPSARPLAPVTPAVPGPSIAARLLASAAVGGRGAALLRKTWVGLALPPAPASAPQARAGAGEGFTGPVTRKVSATNCTSAAPSLLP